MRRILLLFFSLLLIFSGTVRAAIYEFEPSPVDLSGLDHHSYYTWGINWSVPSGEEIIGASLFFDNIRNWRMEPNDLWVHLLDTAAEGVSQGWDNQGGEDFFAGQGILLNHWEDLPATQQDITYLFDVFEIGFLNTFAADGLWGTAFDPDCHFYNDGIQLTVETAPVPVPATFFLFCTGIFCLVGLGRTFNHN